MRTLKFKNIEYVFIIEAGVMYNLVFENSKNLYDIINQIKIGNTDEIILYENKLIDFNKESYLITDLFSIDLNTKKSLTFTYNKLENDYIGDNERIELSEINSHIISLLEKISSSYDLKLEFDSDIKFVDLFNMVSLKYAYTSESLLSDFVNYVKNLKISYNIKILFVLNLFDFIMQEEFLLLKKELEYMNICLFNISGHYKNFDHITKSVIIDEDLCEIC